MNRWMDRLCRVLEGMIAAALALMVALVFGNVVLRYGFNSGITVSEELSRWLFVWSTFLGALVALREHGHLGVDMVVSRLPRVGRRACLVVGQLLMLVLLGMLWKGSFDQTRINWDVTAPTTGWSMAVLHGSGLVFASIGMAIVGLDLVRALRGELRDDELVMVQDSEESAQLKQILDAADVARPVVPR